MEKLAQRMSSIKQTVREIPLTIILLKQLTMTVYLKVKQSSTHQKTILNCQQFVMSIITILIMFYNDTTVSRNTCTFDSVDTSMSTQNLLNLNLGKKGMLAK